MYNLIWMAVSCSAGGADNTYRWVIPSGRSTIPITIYQYRRLIMKRHVWTHKGLFSKVTGFSLFFFFQEWERLFVSCLWFKVFAFFSSNAAKDFMVLSFGDRFSLVRNQDIFFLIIYSVYLVQFHIRFIYSPVESWDYFMYKVQCEWKQSWESRRRGGIKVTFAVQSKGSWLIRTFLCVPTCPTTLHQKSLVFTWGQSALVYVMCCMYQSCLSPFGRSQMRGCKK